MTARCTSCNGVLDMVAIRCNEATCTGCEVRAIELAQRLRDRGQAIASAAHPDDHARVEAAIRQLASTGRPFSANQARAIHGCKGGVVGAAFSALNKAGVIEYIGDTRSSKVNTHGHRIGEWKGTAA